MLRRNIKMDEKSSSFTVGREVHERAQIYISKHAPLWGVVGFLVQGLKILRCNI